MRRGLLRHGYRRLLRPALFASHGGDPEAVHETTLAVLARIGANPVARRTLTRLTRVPATPVELAGITFAGPVGLAAGLDKGASAVRAWPALGFSHVELGTITHRAQPGSERPRVFRAPLSGGVVNRMGFPNEGAAVVAARLAAAGVRRGGDVPGVPVGISLGKSKDVALTDAVEDYLSAQRLLAPHADYWAVNVSSPNTPGLRTLQDGGLLRELSTALVAAAEVPVLVKIAPDLSEAALDEVLQVCSDTGVAGLVATNTTLARDGLVGLDQRLVDEAGGLSGAPLTRRALAVVTRVVARSPLPVIGVGGIMTADDATALLDAGARLVQTYTGFLYAGPALLADITTTHHHRREPR